VWQKLYEELKDRDFTIIAVAMDSRADAARPHIESSRATYVSLIDENHLVADLYHMTNVPQAVWIDEKGRIVRPSEVAGFVVSPKFRKVRAHYIDAIRDWVDKGSESVHALPPDEVRNRTPEISPEIARAHANFHLGQDLWNHGNRKEGRRFLEAATELSPNSWNFYRQMQNLDKSWKASGPAYFKRVIGSALRGESYYPLAEMDGMQEIFDK
jgi:hypothetical protein